MIIKQRNEPLPLQKLNTLIARLPKNHPQIDYLQAERAKYQKGYNGERRLDYYLASLPDEFTILNDITIKYRNLNVQIDSLIISPNAIYIVDVKNMSHTVTLDTTLNQCTQDDGQKTIGYQYPITQSENIQMYLIQWLKKHGISGMPIYYFIAFAYSSTILNVIGNKEEIMNVVTYAEQIPKRIIDKNEKVAEFSGENNILKKQIIHLLRMNSFDFDIDVFKRYKISAKEILPGVRCPNCSQLGMVRTYGKWKCEPCQTYCPKAHIQAIQEYQLLFNEKITTKETMRFLQCHSRYIAYRLKKSFIR